jgi:hypothetical protein
VNRASVAVAFVAVAALVAGCSVQATAAPSIGPLGSADLTTAGPDDSGLPASSFGPPQTPSADTTPITIDPTLLAFLPVMIDTTPVKEDLDVASDALQDQALPRIATGLDAAVAVDTVTGNLVTAWVVRLRPDAFGDTAYQQWRDSYDDGACNAAGGIVGRAEATLGGRDTYVTSCVAALRTYHVWLPDQGVVVSASSIGTGRFGEKLMSALRFPGSTDVSPTTTP